ncbi:hypothetical protein M2271_007895 [Streptomyces sp. LBL]|nr:hypothetical protein [Streptomyces sp. LBL]
MAPEAATSAAADNGAPESRLSSVTAAMPRTASRVRTRRFAHATAVSTAVAHHPGASAHSPQAVSAVSPA